MAITWNTGSAAARFRHNLKLKKNKKIKLIRVTPTGISLISCKDPKPQARKRSSAQAFKLDKGPSIG